MAQIIEIRVMGIVQGVGFRPFVYNLARRLGIGGTVRNDGAGVMIRAVGEVAQLAEFQRQLRESAPPLAVIDGLDVAEMGAGEVVKEFVIVASGSSAAINTLISPDVATCDDCLREMNDPTDRRYHYPFINCTNCGPRFTIIRALPYDRPLTTMRDFVMCAACQAEYDDPTNRRFHAQPNACPVCGPRVCGIDLATARAQLAAGKILAVKGLGGYHLVCDARNEAAVRLLRERKRRPHKPFALMVRDVATVRGICEVSSVELALLTSPQRPIVLLNEKRTLTPQPPTPAPRIWREARGGEEELSKSVAPNQKRLGVMLPYTPLHHLLLAGECDLLVMTSGNISGEPIIYDDAEAQARLAHLVDGFVEHNRPIHTPCDDSVVRVLASGKTQFLRRSRGYAPRPLQVGFDRPILAIGGHLKNTFCMGKGEHAFLSQHIGDLATLPSLDLLRVAIGRYEQIFDIAPAVVAHDLHPTYQSTQVAGGIAADHHIAVQHHHAHIASVLAEHNLTERVIGVAFDGSGYGTDGTVWGGEFLLADRADFERVAYLEPIPLIGGEQAVRQPWRVAAAWLQQQLGDGWLTRPIPFCQQINRAEWNVLRQMMQRNLNSPPCSSVGRLFDAVAALLDVRQTVSYEGQAAMELEQMMRECDPSLFDTAESYPIPFNPPRLQTRPLLLAILNDLQNAVSPSLIATKFHNGVVAAIVAVCDHLRDTMGLNTVALSGGVFQNVYLLERTMEQLTAQRFRVCINERVPPNDGGLSLGQAVVADARVMNRPTLRQKST